MVANFKFATTLFHVANRLAPSVKEMYWRLLNAIRKAKVVFAGNSIVAYSVIAIPISFFFATASGDNSMGGSIELG